MNYWSILIILLGFGFGDTWVKNASDPNVSAYLQITGIIFTFLFCAAIVDVADYLFKLTKK